MNLTASPISNLEQQRIVNREVELLPLTTVKRVQEASAGLHDDWSDAATEALNNSVIDRQDQLNILNWIESVSIEDELIVERQKAMHLLSANGRV